MEFKFLTENFYEKYENYKEVEKKKNRPYTVVYIIEYNNLLFAIPLRHNINHRYKISTVDNKGLDLSKVLVITDRKYIDNKKVFINDEEYKLLKNKERKIVSELQKYIKLYKRALKKPEIARNKSLIEKSCLQYFHKELGIEK